MSSVGEVVHVTNQYLILRLLSLFNNLLFSTCQTELVESYCKEIDIYLTILFLVIEFNKHRELEEYRLPEFLFDLVVRLKEHFTKTFPLKKVFSLVQMSPFKEKTKPVA